MTRKNALWQWQKICGSGPYQTCRNKCIRFMILASATSTEYLPCTIFTFAAMQIVNGSQVGTLPSGMALFLKAQKTTGFNTNGLLSKNNRESNQDANTGFQDCHKQRVVSAVSACSAVQHLAYIRQIAIESWATCQGQGCNTLTDGNSNLALSSLSTPGVAAAAFLLLRYFCCCCCLRLNGCRRLLSTDFWLRSYTGGGRCDV